MDSITSPQNVLVKRVKSLALKKNRDELGMYFIEGARFVEEALRSGAEVQYIFVSEKFYAEQKEFTAHLEQHRVSILPEKLFKDISDTETPQGILAVIKMKTCGFEELLKGKGLLLILDSVQDPGNMGTVIRTADAAGFDGIIVSRGCVDVYNPKVLRSTMGSIFHLPIYRAQSLSGVIDKLKSHGIRVYATHLNASKNIYELDVSRKTAFVIGNEANGVSEEALRHVDELVKIPMPGKAESLNAAVAAGLFMYESVRQGMM